MLLLLLALPSAGLLCTGMRMCSSLRSIAQGVPWWSKHIHGVHSGAWGTGRMVVHLQGTASRGYLRQCQTWQRSACPSAATKPYPPRLQQQYT